jgi:hypothetical protein
MINNNLLSINELLNSKNHICTSIINIDDEQCILNMNKNLFQRKFKIEINTCKNYEEL